MPNPWIISCVRSDDVVGWSLTHVPGKSERYLGWMEGCTALTTWCGPSSAKMALADLCRMTNVNICEIPGVRYDQE